MPPSLKLPRADGTIALYTLSGRAPIQAPAGPIQSRIGMAAVHVVADPRAAINPTLEVALDWDATLKFRHYLWSLGLAVAEAMDTSQRGMGFDWTTAKQLIKRSVAESKTVPGAVLASGAGTDQFEPGPRVTIADVEAAYEEQCAWIEGCGGRIILMASRALTACAKSPDDYVKVYGRILSQAREPVIVHWLGEMFDPALAGLLGFARPRSPVEHTPGHRQRVRGQDRRREDLAAGPGARDRDAEAVSHLRADVYRRRLRLSDDDPRRWTAPLRRAARHLRRHRAGRRGRAQGAGPGDMATYETILAPTLTLSRHVFGDPTRFYKTGVVFAAYLNGHQSHFRDGGWDGERTLGRAPGRAVQAHGRGGIARDPRWRPRACAAC